MALLMAQLRYFSLNISQFAPSLEKMYSPVYEVASRYLDINACHFQLWHYDVDRRDNEYIWFPSTLHAFGTDPRKPLLGNPLAGT